MKCNSKLLARVFHSLRWRLANISLLLLLSGCGLLSETLAIPSQKTTASFTSTPAHSTPLPTYIIRQPVRSTPESLSALPTTSPTPTKEPTEAAPTPTLDPLFSSDLLYISEEKLMRWDYVTNYTVPLIDKVIDYSLQPDGKQIALLRTRNIAANGIEIHDLDLFDLSTMKITRLVSEIPRVALLTLSPDENWLAYWDSDGEGGVFAVSIDHPDQRIELGTCQSGKTQDCSSLLWAPDSLSLLWSDTRGLWLASLLQHRSRLIHPNTVRIADPEGNQAPITVAFSPEAWSPNGRFILTRLATASGNNWYAILDVKQGRLVEMPGAFEQDPQILSVEWLDNGKILDLTGSISETRIIEQVFGHIYQVIPTRDDLMILEKTFPITIRDREASSSPGEAMLPASATSTVSGAAAIGYSGIVIGKDQPTLALFLYNWEDLSLTKLFELSFPVDRLVWSPDGNGVLIIGENNELLYLPFSGDQPIDLSQMLGLKPSHFHWTQPSSRDNPNS